MRLGVDLRLTLGGYLFEIKRHPDGPRTALVKVDARRPRTLIVPFDGVICEEIEPWEENHQKWRVLRAIFDPSIDTHCAVQKFYFDGSGMLQRHDYFTDVAKGNVAHYCMDYKTFDGFVFPTRRRVVARGDGEFTATGGPSSVLIDIESVVVNRD